MRSYQTLDANDSRVQVADVVVNCPQVWSIDGGSQYVTPGRAGISAIDMDADTAWRVADDINLLPLIFQHRSCTLVQQGLL